MSTSCSGDASRSFIIGSRLWPPAMMRALPPARASAAIAPSTLVARSYSNGPGVCTEGPFLGRQVAAHTRLLAGLVLHRRVGADDRRARHSLRPRLADLGVEQPRRQAAARDVAKRRSVRAGRRDRGLAAKPRERQRSLRVDLRDPRRGDVATLLEVAQPLRGGAGIEAVDQPDRILQ